MNGSQRLALVFLGVAAFVFWLNNSTGSTGAGRSRLDDVIDAAKGRLGNGQAALAPVPGGGSWSGSILDSTGARTGQTFRGNAIPGQPVILPPVTMPTAAPPRFRVQGF